MDGSCTHIVRVLPVLVVCRHGAGWRLIGSDVRCLGERSGGLPGQCGAVTVVDVRAFDAAFSSVAVAVASVAVAVASVAVAVASVAVAVASVAA